jgi:hypothetical protein
MAHDVFISHSTNNRPVANAVCAALENAGIRCWIAPRDVLPGRSYSGEITRAIQQSRAFVLIFSEHSNNSEQVLREVQLAANSRLHIVQFRIDPVLPSDDLEYYLSGPHWLDAVTPPLEDHLAQLKSSMKALLALPRAAAPDKMPTPAPSPPIAPISRPPSPEHNIAPLTAAPSPTTRPSSNLWKWIALGVAAFVALGTVAIIIIFTLLRPHLPTTAVAPLPSPSPSLPSSAAVEQNAKIESNPVPQLSVAPKSGSSVLTTEEAELYVREFHRDVEHGDLKAAMAYLDDTVNYYSFGPKDKTFIAEQMKQYFAAVPVRAFAVADVKVQAGPKPTVATVIFETHYSVRDIYGTLSTGRTRTEWDVVRKSDGLKIVRTNWMTYPDATPSR